MNDIPRKGEEGGARCPASVDALNGIKPTGSHGLPSGPDSPLRLYGVRRPANLLPLFRDQYLTETGPGRSHTTVPVPFCRPRSLRGCSQ